MKFPDGMWSYLLWQLPSWALAALFLAFLNRLLGLPAWAVGALFLLVVVKDVCMFPVMKDAFRPSDPGRERLIGARGRAVEVMAPRGYVRISGELWRAEVREPGKTVPAGSQVVVRDARGLTLIVEAEQGSRPAS